MTIQTDDLRRIFSRITKSSFLHIEDSLHMTKQDNTSAPKLRFFGGKYKNSGGMDSYVAHYVDLAAARPLLADLANIHAMPENWVWKDYKGTTTGGGQLLSNSLEMNTRTTGDKRVLYLTLTLIQGEKDASGIVKPVTNRKPVANINMMLELDKAREMAFQLQAYLQAAETCRLWAHMQHTSTRYPAYPTSQRSQSPSLSPAPEQQGRGGSSTTTYGNGTSAPKDDRSVKIFGWYKEAVGTVPVDSDTLRVWWEQSKNLKKYKSVK